MFLKFYFVMIICCVIILRNYLGFELFFIGKNYVVFGITVIVFNRLNICWFSGGLMI